MHHSFSSIFFLFTSPTFLTNTSFPFYLSLHVFSSPLVPYLFPSSLRFTPFSLVCHPCFLPLAPVCFTRVFSCDHCAETPFVFSGSRLPVDCGRPATSFFVLCGCCMRFLLPVSWLTDFSSLECSFSFS